MRPITTCSVARSFRCRHDVNVKREPPSRRAPFCIVEYFRAYNMPIILWCIAMRCARCNRSQKTNKTLVYLYSTLVQISHRPQKRQAASAKRFRVDVDNQRGGGGGAMMLLITYANTHKRNAITHARLTKTRASNSSSREKINTNPASSSAFSFSIALFAASARLEIVVTAKPEPPRTAERAVAPPQSTPVQHSTRRLAVQIGWAGWRSVMPRAMTESTLYNSLSFAGDVGTVRCTFL